MKDLRESYLVGEFVKTLTADITSPPNTSFVCCPLMAYTSGRNTVIARFYGPIGIQNLVEFQTICGQLTSGTALKIIMDLEHASFTKAALGVLIAFAASCFGIQKKLYLYKINQEIRQAFTDDDLVGFFAYLTTPKDVIATLKV